MRVSTVNAFKAVVAILLIALSGGCSRNDSSPVKPADKNQNKNSVVSNEKNAASVSSGAPVISVPAKDNPNNDSSNDISNGASAENASNNTRSEEATNNTMTIEVPPPPGTTNK